MGIRQRIKFLMDDLPFGADIYWQLRGKRKPGRRIMSWKI